MDTHSIAIRTWAAQRAIRIVRQFEGAGVTGPIGGVLPALAIERQSD
jgi:hypothetical protein